MKKKKNETKFRGDLQEGSNNRGVQLKRCSDTWGSTLTPPQSRYSKVRLVFKERLHVTSGVRMRGVLLWLLSDASREH